MNRPLPPTVPETAAATPLPSPPPSQTGALVPLIIGSALFMQILDSTVIANALPSMARAMHESPLTLNLAITSYLLATAVFLPISGWVAHRYGARRVFRIAIVLFAVSSFLCGLSQNLPELIIARMLQGAAGAMMTPVGRLVLLKTVPKSELVQALAYVTMPAMLGPVVGPPIGGLIVTYLSWRWIFFINIPIAVLGVVLVSLFIPDIREDEHKPLDWTGFGLTAVGLASLIFGFESIGRASPPAWVTATLFVVGAICLAIYVRHARRSPHPVLDLSVFKTPTFNASIVGGSVMRLSLGATPFLLAMLLQVAFGLSAFAAGLMTFASAAGALLMKPTAGPVLKRWGFKTVLIVDSLIAGVIFMSYALFKADTPHWVILIALFVGGYFRSLQFTALNALSFADIPQSGMSNASTLNSMSLPLAQTLGIGICAVTLQIIQHVHGSAVLTAAEVSPAFVVIGVLSMLGVIQFIPMSPHAGAVLSGRPAPPDAEP
jgi:EmrB/QacA subfamily drug resistance transporter